MKTAILTTCDNTIKANLIKSKLEAHGIHAYLFHENFTSLMPSHFNILGSGVQVVVNQLDLEEAISISKLQTGSLTCPNCQSADLEMKTKNWKEKLKVLFILIFLFSPGGNLLNKFKCNNCGEEFSTSN